MPVYVVNAYDINDFETFKDYPLRIRILLEKYGAKVLAMETNPKTLEGICKTMNAIIEFPSEETVNRFTMTYCSLTLRNLHQMMADNPKAREIADKGNFIRAIEVYNRKSK